MSLYFGIPILMLGAVLQSVIIEKIEIFGGRPDLVLLLVITWTIIRGLNEGMTWGFVGGLFCDLLSGGDFGLWTISLTLATFVAGQPWIHTLGPTSIRLALMSALGTLLGHTIFLSLMNMRGFTVNISQAYANTVGPAALLNFILSPFAFIFLVWFHQRSLQRGR